MVDAYLVADAFQGDDLQYEGRNGEYDEADADDVCVVDDHCDLGFGEIYLGDHGQEIFDGIKEQESGKCKGDGGSDER